jgi:hypothetical protein
MQARQNGAAWRLFPRIYSTAQYGAEEFLRMAFSKLSCLYSATPPFEKGLENPDHRRPCHVFLDVVQSP